jgi:CRP-like cAMP-binding protein
MNTHAESLVTVKAGETVIQAKKVCDGIYIVKKGQLKVYKVDASGTNHPIGIIGPGEFIGETAYFMERPYTSSVVAMTDCELVKKPLKVLDAQLKEVPKWLTGLTKGLVMRLHRANEILRRNNWIDKEMADQLKTLEDNAKKAKEEADAEAKKDAERKKQVLPSEPGAAKPPVTPDAKKAS